MMKRLVRNSILYILTMALVVLPVQLIQASEITPVVAESSLCPHHAATEEVSGNNQIGSEKSPCCDHEQLQQHKCDGTCCDDCNSCSTGSMALLPVSKIYSQNFIVAPVNSGQSRLHSIFLPRDLIPPRNIC